MILYNNIVEISKNRWIGYMLKVAFLLASSIYITLGQGQNNSWSQSLFQMIKNSVHMPINCKFSPSNDILTIFSIQMHGRSKLTLP